LEAYRPFDLSSRPPFRVRLYRADNGDHILLLVVHHILCDQWSLVLMLTEIPQLYDSVVAGTVPPIPGPRSLYADFVAAQVRMLADPDAERQWQYWKERLRGQRIGPGLRAPMIAQVSSREGSAAR
jgi:hypothetical protein